MRIAFAGTPEFARVALSALLKAGHEVAYVLTQPDRPAGRGLKLQASPVKQLALEHDLPIWQPTGLKLDGRYATEALVAQKQMHDQPVEAMVVVAYGLILPRWVLDTPRQGCMNIHASLLPRWRGAAPIHRAIEAGDSETGVSIMRMDEGLDTGAVLAMQSLRIASDDTTASLHDKLAHLGADMMVQVLQDLPHLTAQPQNPAGVCYAHKIDKAESLLTFNDSAESIARRIRAFHPFPVVSLPLPLADGSFEMVKVWAANVLPDSAEAQLPAKPAGTVLCAKGNDLRVQCASGQLRLTRLQRAGGKPMDAAAFLNGTALLTIPS